MIDQWQAAYLFKIFAESSVIGILPHLIHHNIKLILFILVFQVMVAASDQETLLKCSLCLS